MNQEIKYKIKKHALEAYFYEGKALQQDDENYENVIAVAKDYCLYLSCVLGQKVSEETQKSNEAFVKRTYDNSPAIQMCIEGRKVYSGKS
jgi:hypothetical protein